MTRHKSNRPGARSPSPANVKTRQIAVAPKRGRRRPSRGPPRGRDLRSQENPTPRFTRQSSARREAARLFFTAFTRFAKHCVPAPKNPRYLCHGSRRPSARGRNRRALAFIPIIVTAEDLARRLGAGAVHQGVMLEALSRWSLSISPTSFRKAVSCWCSIRSPTRTMPVRSCAPRRRLASMPW